jgi:chromosome segregation ATPase
MQINNPSELATLAAAAVGALVSIAFATQKIISTWKGSQAETSIIGLMHTELERLSEQNTKLSVELGKLQEEILGLNKALRNLTTENQSLHTQVQSLTAEVTRLQAVISEGINGRAG